MVDRHRLGYSTTYYRVWIERLRATPRGRRKLARIKFRTLFKRRATRFGITIEQQVALLVAQDFKCASCLKVMKRPELDHDHETNRPRAFLCGRCNKILGLARDEVVVLSSLVLYLEKHRSEA